MSELSVFTKFEVYGKVLGGAVMAWDLSKMFKVTTPITFEVWASRDGVGDWTLVTTTVDQYVAIDVNRWIYGVAPQLHYQIRFSYGGTVYESIVKQTIGNLDVRDSNIVNEIIRKECLRLEKYAGQCGYLYKRRRWGVACPDCLDYDTGEVKSAHCLTCFGTGITGGYFAPIEYWVAPAVPGVGRRTATQPEGQGVIEDRTWAVRAINCPWLDTGDVWVDFDTDQRYVVQSVKEITYRSVPIVFEPVELRTAPATDVIYELPRPDDAASSSS